MTRSLRGAITWDEWQELPPFERDALIDWHNETNASDGGGTGLDD